jgi:hypothetical protein
MEKIINDYIDMNQSGKVLELCEKYYDENVLMMSNGAVFAKTMLEAYNKQKGFVEAVQHFEVTLVSKLITDDRVELVFNYKMEGKDAALVAFTGKHVQTWQGSKIVKEEYFSVN